MMKKCSKKGNKNELSKTKTTYMQNHIYCAETSKGQLSSQDENWKPPGRFCQIMFKYKICGSY